MINLHPEIRKLIPDEKCPACHVLLEQRLNNLSWDCPNSTSTCPLQFSVEYGGDYNGFLVYYKGVDYKGVEVYKGAEMNNIKIFLSWHDRIILNFVTKEALILENTVIHTSIPEDLQLTKEYISDFINLVRTFE